MKNQTQITFWSLAGISFLGGLIGSILKIKQSPYSIWVLSFTLMALLFCLITEIALLYKKKN